MSAWSDALDRDFAKKVLDLAEAYDSELDLLANAQEFGEAVFDQLVVTQTIDYKGTPDEE